MHSVATGELEAELEGHTGIVFDVCAMPDGRLVSASADGTLRVWQNGAAGWALVKVLSEATATAAAATAPTPATFAALAAAAAAPASTAAEGPIFDAPGAAAQLSPRKHEGALICVCALADGRVVTGSNGHALRVWDLETGLSRAIGEHKGTTVFAVAALSGGRVVSSSIDNTVRVWDVDASKQTGIIAGIDKTFLHALGVETAATRATPLAGIVYDVAAMPGGESFVTASADHTLRVWDATTLECARVIASHTDDVMCVAALSNGRLASGSWNKMLRLD